MRRAIVYQIGRLDVNTFSRVNFCIDKDRFETTLSSFAIRDYLEKEGYEPEVVLIYPISLPFNQLLINNEKFRSTCHDEFYKLLKSAFDRPDDYLKNPAMFFKGHPHSRDVKDFKVIHSLGKYKTTGASVSFECYYSDIVLMLLIDMIQRFLKEGQEIEKIIIDISSGHNIYVSALLEAIRYFGTWLKLYDWNNEGTAIEIAFSDPIIGSDMADEHKIYFEKQTVKAFFTSPLKNEDIQDYSLAKSVYSGSEQRSRKGQLQSMLESFVLTFSPIKNNAPLVIYHLGYYEEKEILGMLKEFIEHAKGRLTERYDKSPNLRKDDYLKVILACGFYLGISRILREKGISRADMKGVDIAFIRECFKDINALFGLNLNDVVLGNEIDKLKKDIKSDTEWTRLIDILYPEDRKETAPQKRNFFAHGGFEGTITECKRQNDMYYLRYNQKYITTIQTWLKDSV